MINAKHFPKTPASSDEPSTEWEIIIDTETRNEAVETVLPQDTAGQEHTFDYISDALKGMISLTVQERLSAIITELRTFTHIVMSRRYS